MPVTLALLALNLPAVLTFLIIGLSSWTLVQGWPSAFLSLAMNVGIYALLGGYACMLKRSLNANRRT